MDLYTLTTGGSRPLTLPEVKSALKLTTAQDDTFLSLLMDAALSFAEGYTGRDFRGNTWTLSLDVFETRICLRKSRAQSITSVKYFDQTSPTPVEQTVDTATYYLKVGSAWSEVLLKTDQEWPTDVDDLQAEQRIEIVFVTEVPAQYTDPMKQGLLRHITYLYQNRGDCSADADTVRASGASLLYEQFRIARV